MVTVLIHWQPVVTLAQLAKMVPVDWQWWQWHKWCHWPQWCQWIANDAIGDNENNGRNGAKGNNGDKGANPNPNPIHSHHWCQCEWSHCRRLITIVAIELPFSLLLPLSLMVLLPFDGNPGHDIAIGSIEMVPMVTNEDRQWWQVHHWHHWMHSPLATIDFLQFLSPVASKAPMARCFWYDTFTKKYVDGNI